MTQIAVGNDQPRHAHTHPEHPALQLVPPERPARQAHPELEPTHPEQELTRPEQAHPDQEPTHPERAHHEQAHTEHPSTAARPRAAADSMMQCCLRAQSKATQHGAYARFLGRNPLHPDARAPYRAAVGESEVASILAALGPEWAVFHVEPDAPQPDPSEPDAPVVITEPHIDHLIIGPPGIFAITSKNHTGHTVIATGDAIILDTRKTRYMAKSLYEASRASEFLQRATGAPVAATPLIVVVGVQKIARRIKPPLVRVVPSSKLVQVLAKEPRVMSDDMVAYLARTADLCSTWRNRTMRVEETRQHVRFERLQEEVRTAGKRRRVWSLALSLALLVGMPATAFATSTLVISLLQA